FDDFLREADSALFARYRAHRDGSARLRGPAESALLLETGAQVSRFLGRLFGVERDLKRLREAAGREAPLFRVKRDFVQRRVFRKGPKDRPRASDFSALDAEVRPLLAAAACRDPRASFARNDAELLVAIVIETLLEVESAPTGPRSSPATRSTSAGGMGSASPTRACPPARSAARSTTASTVTSARRTPARRVSRRRIHPATARTRWERR